MGLIAQYQQGAFSTPANGDDGDADVVRANDNAVRVKHNSHDADPTIHVQTALLASRPAVGNAGAVFISTDGLRGYVDNGAAWVEIDYLNKAAGGTVTGATTFSNGVTIAAGGLTITAGALIVSAGGAVITGNSTVTGTLTVTSTINSQTISAAANFTGTVTVATGLTVSAGGVAVTGNSTITGTLGGITTLTATNLVGTLSTAAQPNITSVGTLAGCSVSQQLSVAGAANGAALAISSAAAHTLNSGFAINIAQTWNGAAQTFRMIYGALTDTASAADSAFLCFDVGVQTRVFAVRKNGLIETGQGTLIRNNSAGFTNGAAAASGTLTNAPAAGNPTKWIPIDDNGTTRYIPAW
jgi:hypothetical protein